MATKNAKLMGKKITKPTISKPSNTVIRKVDKPRTAMTNLKKDEKSIKDAIASINYNKQYANTKRYNLNNELKANREKQTKVQKVIDSRTKANNKDLSKSLGSVANNKGMKKSNIRGTMSEQRNRYYNSMVDADKALDRVNRAGTRKNERAYAEQAYFKAKDNMKAAAKQYNSLKKLKK